MIKGFTIIEILVVMAILALVGVLVLIIFTQALRGNNKAQVLSAIKKNGQTVLETMDKTIRDADNVVCVSNDSYTIVVADKTGAYIRFQFKPATAISNGLINEDNPIRPATESIVDFANNVCNESPISSVPITDTGLQTGASIQTLSSCNNDTGYLFNKNPQAGFKNIVTICFQVAPPVGVSSFLAGQIDAVPFSETIELR